MENVTEQNKEHIRDKLDFYMDNKIKIHAVLHDGGWVNGIILKKTKENVYWVQEQKMGEIFLFVQDIKKLMQYKERVEVKG